MTEISRVVELNKCTHPRQGHLCSETYGVAATQAYAFALVGGEAFGILVAQCYGEMLIVVDRQRVHYGIERAQEVETAFDERLRHTVELEQAFVLLKEDVSSCRTGTGKQHDKGHLTVS